MKEGHTGIKTGMRKPLGDGVWVKYRYEYRYESGIWAEDVPIWGQDVPTAAAVTPYPGTRRLGVGYGKPGFSFL